MIATLLAFLLATVNSPYSPPSYACDGVTAAFTVPFPYQASGDLKITSTTAAGVANVLTQGTDWAVNLSSTSSTATLTLTSPGTKCPSGSVLKVERNAGLTQPQSFRSQTTYNPATHETAYDRAVMEIQQVNDKAVGTGTPASTAYVDQAIANTLTGGTVVQPITWNLTGDGSTTVFSIPNAAVSSPDLYIVTIDGVFQRPTTDYTVSSGAGTVTFASAPALNGVISVRSTGYARALSVGDSTLVLATGSSVPRMLKDWFADVANGRAFGADATGATDSAGAINSALTVIGKGVVVLPPGVFRIDSAITVPSFVTLRGSGFTDDKTVGARAATVILKNFNGTGVVLGANVSDACGVEDLQVDSNAGKTGDGVQLKCSRGRIIRVASTNQGNDGFRIGADEAGAVTVNANLWRMDQDVAYGNGRHGLFVHHSNTSTTGTFPQGTPNVNAGVATNLDLHGNTGSGLDVKNAIDNRFYGLTGQGNTANCIHFEADARRMEVYSSYCEANTAGDYLLDAGANTNLISGTRFLTVQPSITDNGTGNRIEALEGDLNLFAFRKFVNISNRAGGGITALSFYCDANQGNCVNFNATQGVGTGGKLAVQTKRNGNTPVDRITVDEVGNILFVNGTFTPPPYTFATLPTPTNGMVLYCSDCTIANPCAGGGTGALAKRLNGVWVCN